MESKFEREAPAPTLGERLAAHDRMLNDPRRAWGYEDAVALSRDLKLAVAALAERAEGSCPRCGGSRVYSVGPQNETYRCGVCKGSGSVAAERAEGGEPICPECGSAFIATRATTGVRSCQKCGHVLKAERAEPDGALREEINYYLQREKAGTIKPLTLEARDLMQRAAHALASAPQRAGTEGDG